MSKNQQAGRAIWVDVYAASGFGGVLRRLAGPNTYLRLRGRDDRRGIAIESLIVGPGAYVLLFDADAPGERARWFGPGEEVTDLAQAGITDGFDSLELRDAPPGPNERGYAAWGAE